jgi:hypothetical protein
MSENETQQAPTAPEIPEVQLSETELEQVAGGTLYEIFYELHVKPIVDFISNS